MSVKHIGLVLDYFDTPNARLKLVAIILADHADAEGLCWPSYRKIAERANIHERSVQRHIKELINLGVISKLRTGTLMKTSGGEIQRVTNLYRVNAHVLVAKAGKLSTDGLWINDTDVYLEDDKKARSRSTRVSTKPSLNHQSNRKYLKTVDNHSREIVSLSELVATFAEKDA